VKTQIEKKSQKGEESTIIYSLQDL